VKGRIMRVLTKEADTATSEEKPAAELIDGIKFYEGEDWALVLPDASEPYFHVYAESGSAEASNQLLCRYVEKIEAMRG
jgi:mannose-1-phosphate guanylyltransferase/phosphomannomutase